MKKDTKQIIIKIYNYKFLKNILLEEFANRFLNKSAKVETRLPCKV